MKQQLKNFFFEQKWFRNIFPHDYFLKINGKWSKFSHKEFMARSFKEGEKLEDIQGPTINNWIYCQDDECRHILNWSGSGVKTRLVPGKKQLEDVNDYKCTCCGKKQHFILDIIPIPCNENGIALQQKKAA